MTDNRGAFTLEGEDDLSQDGDDFFTISDSELREYVRTASEGVASLLRSTYGPNGMEKLVQTEDPQGEPELILTADGARVLEAVERGDGFNHPVAAVFVDHVDSLQRSLHDGTTAAVLLAAALVDRGIQLLERGLHPGTVAVGYAAATNRAGVVLDDLARQVGDDRETLSAVARTGMASDLGTNVDTYARAVADTVLQLQAQSDNGWIDADDVKVVPAPETSTVEGLVVRQEPPGTEAVEQKYGAEKDFDHSLTFETPATDISVAVIDRSPDFEETATTLGGDHPDDTGVELETTEEVERYMTQRDHVVSVATDQLRNFGVDLLVSMESIDDMYRTALERADIAVIDQVDTPKADVYRLARLADATVVSGIDEVSAADVGTLDRVEQYFVGEEKRTTFSRAGGPVATVRVTAETDTGRERRMNAVEDALEVTAVASMDDQVTPGGQAAAMAVAADLRSYATSVSGREQLAVDAFAKAVEDVVQSFAENAGLDAVATVTALRGPHTNAESPSPLGIDVVTGDPTDMWEAGVIEPRRVYSQAVDTANTVAEALLTLDQVVFSGVHPEDASPRTQHD